MLVLEIGFSVSSIQLSQVKSLILSSNDFLVLLSEELLLEFNSSIVGSLHIVDVNVNADYVLLKNGDLPLESVNLLVSSLDLQIPLVKLLGLVLLSVVQVARLLLQHLQFQL